MERLAITNLRFGDGINALAGEEQELEALAESLGCQVLPTLSNILKGLCLML